MKESVMLLVVTDDGEMLMHLRDDKAGVVHPGCWAGFGGAVESGESPEDALRRELLEETGVVLHSATFLGDVVDEVSEGGHGDLVHMYFTTGDIRVEDIQLTEGAGIGVFSVGELKSMKVSPFVNRTLNAQEHLLTRC